MRIISVLIFIIVFASCSNNENVEPDLRETYFKEAIIGSWSINTVTVDGQTFLYEHTDGCEKDLFQFYNQEGKEFDFEELVVLNCNNCAPCATSGTNLKWELNGDIINFYFGEQFVLEYKIIEISDTKFTYILEVDYNEDGVLDELEISAERYDPYGNFT